MKTLILSLIVLISTGTTSAQAYQSAFSMESYILYSGMVKTLNNQADKCLQETKDQSVELESCRLAAESLGNVYQAMNYGKGSFTLELYNQFKEAVDTLNNAAELAKEIQGGDK